MPNSDSAVEASRFCCLPMISPDPLLSLIKMFADDPRADKIDLGVGVYRDEAGATPVFRSVKAAEADLLNSQETKSYLGPEGNLDFVDLVGDLILPNVGRSDWFGVQTPGGTGALRLAVELAGASNPEAAVWIGSPSWPIHASIVAATRLKTRLYPCYDPVGRAFNLESTLAALRQAAPGDVVLLQGCGHNPTGSDPDIGEWRQIAKAVATSGALPLLDIAYHGLASDLRNDLAGLRCITDDVEEVLVAYSCDKNFGLYRERTGALFVRARGNGEAVRSSTLNFARAAWSMPPDHGAAVVARILQSPTLASDWRNELSGMRVRIDAVRQALADHGPVLAAVGHQRGLFSLLPLSPGQVEALRRDHGVYLPASGRINVPGLRIEDVPRFACALARVAQ